MSDRAITTLLKSTKFAIMVDETTDRNTDKQLAILARVFNGKTIATVFVDMPVCNLGSAADIFATLDSSFR